MSDYQCYNYINLKTKTAIGYMYLTTEASFFLITCITTLHNFKQTLYQLLNIKLTLKDFRRSYFNITNKNNISFVYNEIY